MIISGKAWKFGDNIDTDVIIPARYLNTTDQRALAEHCMEPVAPCFASRVSPGDVIIAGRNFGCGSSREHAPLALKAAGISCVIAGSFARIFYRNAVNIGLPILESADAVRFSDEGDRLEVDLARGSITNLTKGMNFQAPGLPEFMRDIVAAGGLIEYLRRSMSGKCSG